MKHMNESRGQNASPFNGTDRDTYSFPLCFKGMSYFL